MQTRSIVMFTLIVSLVVIACGLYAADQSQYSNPIHVVNGVAHVTTTNGDQVYSDVEYINGSLVSVKPAAINTATVTPITLPSTSTPFGSFTCSMSSHGVTFTVTNNTPCDQR